SVTHVTGQICNPCDRFIQLCPPGERAAGKFVTGFAKNGAFLCALRHITKIPVTEITQITPGA
ncbi:hypothetical protein, partial [Kosakonia cowanii]|uniref:hypothetical protein n=1 Tax=Kosakonia cowanii TaxID=208223 RepID=UPI0028AB538D